MTRSQMQMLTSVVQALVLNALTCIVMHYTWGHTQRKINHYEFFAGPDYYKPFPDVNYTSLREHTEAMEREHSSNLTASNITKVVLQNANFTVNDTLFTFGEMWGEMTTNKTFWSKSLPKDMLPLLLILPLEYYWMLWLEKILPGRKRVDPTDFSSSAASSAEKMAAEDDVAEEEIIKRWIAKGKVQRSSLSWWNTFLKWAIDQSLGNAWKCLISVVLGYLVIERESLQTLRDDFWIVFLGVFVYTLFSVGSLGTLLSLILVPAYKRVVFIALSDLAWTVLFQAVLNLMLPWLLARGWMQDIISNANQNTRKAALAEAAMNKTVEITFDSRQEL